jgi:acetoin:2,6-dichlorophenolindophenol oxidoreductase subunit alpha
MTSELRIWLYRKMMEIRAFEDASLPYFQQPGHGSHHPCIGHEAVEAAIGATLTNEDYLFSTHRSHGHLLCKGLEPRRIMAELWGKTAGYCHGRGGSMHVTDWTKHVMPSGMVGTSITLAAGAALATLLRGGREVAVAACGDGAVNCGAFHEGVNMAAIWRLPMVVVCENNGFAVTTRMDKTTPIHRLSDRAAAYGIPGCTIDGTDPEASYEVIAAAVELARRGDGPSIVEATVRRWPGHAAWDRGPYLTEAERELRVARDPLPLYRARLIEGGVATVEQIAAIDAEMKAAMAEAVRFAEDSPAPDLTKEEAVRYVYTAPDTVPGVDAR